MFNTDYEYADGKTENSTTNLISKFSQSYGCDSVLSYDYSYDANGNITEIKQNGKLTNKYVYDSLNELKEEYDYVNKFYINYSYDGAGNLQNKYEQVLDPNYGYPTGTQNGNTYKYADTQVLCTFNLCKIRVLFAIVDSIQLELLGVMSFLS